MNLEQTQSAKAAKPDLHAADSSKTAPLSSAADQVPNAAADDHGLLHLVAAHA